MEINELVAQKVLVTVDAGLSHGLGQPKPGSMCVEAAVCFALGLPHGDDPGCVSPALRSLKIRLNDSAWSSPEARAKGLRRLAVAQLGTKDTLDEREFVQRVALMTTKVFVPIALRAAASLAIEPHKTSLETHALACETAVDLDAAADAAYAAYAATRAAYAAADAAADAAARAAADAAYAAYAAAYAAADAAADAAARAAARDKILGDFAERVVQILVAMKAEGCQWLYLTEAA